MVHALDKTGRDVARPAILDDGNICNRPAGDQIGLDELAIEFLFRDRVADYGQSGSILDQAFGALAHAR